MAYTIDRTGDANASHTKEGTTWRLPYVLEFTGAAEKDQARVANTAYATFAKYILQNQKKFRGYYWESFDVTGQKDAPGVFDCTVTYGPKGNQREERKNPTCSFSTTAQAEHMQVSYETVTRKAATGFDLRNYNKGINVTPEEVKGCDVMVPTWNHNIQVDLPATFVTASFCQTMYQKTGTVNDDSIWFFGERELLFLGINANSYWEMNEETEENELWYNMTFQFAGMPTVTKTFANGIGEVTKKGWDYAWAVNKIDAAITNSGGLYTFQTPAQINVERVYQATSFDVFNTLLSR